MSVKELERRILTSPLRPLTLRKRKNRKRQTRNRRDDEPPQNPPAAGGKGAEGNDDPPESPTDSADTNPDDNPDRDGDSPGTIEGYAAVFHNEADPGSEYCLWDDPSFKAVERIARGAFARACREGDDCRALYNHDANLVLGRTASGTMRLQEDETGLKYSVDLPDTQLARDLATLVERGDINGSSFGFVVEQESWRESEEEGGKRVAVRTVESVRLLDVGPVTYPAYASTTSGAGGATPDQSSDPAPSDDPAEGSSGRSRKRRAQRAFGSIEEARDSYRRWKDRQDLASLPIDAKLAAARLRAIEVAECV